MKTISKKTPSFYLESKHKKLFLKRSTLFYVFYGQMSHYFDMSFSRPKPCLLGVINSLAPFESPAKLSEK